MLIRCILGVLSVSTLGGNILEDVRCVERFPYKSNWRCTSIPERELLGKERDREVVMVIETLSQVDVTYKSSERMTLTDAQEAAQMASMEDEGNDDDRHSVDSDDNRDEPTKEMAWNFHDLQGGNHRRVSALQAIRDLCTKDNVNEPKTLVAAQSIIKDEISFISRVVELTDQLSKVKKKCENHEKKHKMSVHRLTDIAAQPTLMQQKRADTLADVFRGVVLLAVFLKKARDEIREKSGKDEEHSSIERVRSDRLKAGLVDLACQVLNVEESLRISHPVQKRRWPLRKQGWWTHSNVMCYIIYSRSVQRFLRFKHM